MLLHNPFIYLEEKSKLSVWILRPFTPPPQITSHYFPISTKLLRTVSLFIILPKHLSPFLGLCLKQPSYSESEVSKLLYVTPSRELLKAHHKKLPLIKVENPFPSNIRLFITCDTQKP